METNNKKKQIQNISLLSKDQFTQHYDLTVLYNTNHTSAFNQKQFKHSQIPIPIIKINKNTKYIQKNSAYNDKVGSHKKEPRRAKSPPSESAKQESSPNARKRQSRYQKRRAQKKDHKIAEDGRLPRGRR